MKKLSTLFFSLLVTGAASAQIPNGGFENWTSHGSYSTPDGWSTLDSTINALSLGAVTCTEGSPGYGGSAHLIQLTSKSLGFATVPGAAISGTIATSGTSFSITSGFANATRPQSLTGEWQYVPQSSDQGSIAVLLTKWNSSLSKRDTVSYTSQLLSGSVTTMVPFSFNLSYQLGILPDTGVVLMLSGKTSGGAANSYLYADDLAFSGSVPLGVVTINNAASQIGLFPNPATSYATLSYESKTAGTVQIDITNVNGRVVKQINYTKAHGINSFPIDVSDISVGIYFVKLTDDEGSSVHKLVVE